MSEAISQFVFAHDGKQYVARVFRDDHMGAPWIEHDGHGPVREVRSRGARNAGKRPGERVMHSNGHTVWLYDWQAACKMARVDGWDAEPIGAPGRVARAVAADFERMQGWINDAWHWVGVGVAAVADDGTFPDDDREYYRTAVWGIESDDPEYHRSTAIELTGEF